jgi:hypothetical protein
MSDKVPLKDYHRPVLQALQDLGGRAPIPSILQRVREIMGDRLSSVDLDELPSGGPRWKKDVNFAKKALADQLLVGSTGDKWFITDRGKDYLKSGRVVPVGRVDADDALMYLRQHRDKVVHLVTKWFEREHGQDSVEPTTIEAALRRLFHD